MEVINKTPFQVKTMLLQDTDGRDQVVVAVKATFDIGERGSLSISEEQAEILMEDEFAGEPGSSSILKECEATLPKLSTDVVVTGHVFGGPGIKQLDAGIRVGNLRNVCRVFGERQWIKKTAGASISDPRPFEQVALLYENAFGGFDTSNEKPELHESEPRNPVGCGLVAKKTKLPIEELRVPSIEDPGKLISGLKDRPCPVGFGFLAPLWQPRFSFAGTYDEQWQEERAPLLPVDFDPRFFNSANPKLISDHYLEGGETIQLVNMGKVRKLQFQLPRIELDIVNVTRTSRRSILEPRLNTVLVEADEPRVTLLWKATEDVFQKVHKLWFTRVRANV